MIALGSKTLKLYTLVHTWSGLLAGFALFIAFYAGAITMFHDELQQWADPGLRHVGAASVEQAQQLLDDVVTRYPASRGNLTLMLQGEETARSYAWWFETVDGRSSFRNLTAPGAASFDGEHQARTGLPDLIYRLHYTLGLPATFGLYLMGFICVIYGLALISGLIIHLPQLFGDLFSLRIGKNLKRLWQDAHNVIGVLSLPFHLMYAFTGALLCIALLFFAAFNFLVFDGKGEAAMRRVTAFSIPRESANQPATMLPVSALLARADAAVPGLQATRLRLERYGDSSALAIVQGRAPGAFIADVMVFMDAGSGRIVKLRKPGEREPYWAAEGGLTAFHYGQYGGAVLKFVYFGLGLAGSFLFYSGNLLWLESRRKRRQPQQPRHHRVLARFAVGLPLGCVLGIALAAVVTLSLPESLADHVSWEWRAYYAGFFGALLWALARPPIRAAIELLWACAIAMIALPVIDALITGDHLLRSALQRQWPVFGTDLVALLMGLGFAAMARAAQRRARDGEPNSVWALPTKTAITEL
ncbi:PepSY-associated TM helix domain-containing protein [Hydrocarboniphaga sp.]|uniref:PepSY-associated TM helix domain-containing protein n=1 Tax=Hydrocarboniphaga sp. TaxID=2033016 RepID=UPI003D0F5133